jgi:hypothetical protein
VFCFVLKISDMRVRVPILSQAEGVCLVIKDLITKFRDVNLRKARTDCM